MGQPKHIRVVDDNGDVDDVVIPVLEIIASAAHRFLKTGDPVGCHPRWSRITKLLYRTNDEVRGEVEQISVEGAANGNLCGPRARGAYKRTDRTISSGSHRQNSSLVR